MLQCPKSWKAKLLASVFVVSSLLAPISQAAGAVEESPSALAMAGDVLFVRPALAATTVLGSAVWLVSLPFSAAGGNVKEATNTLVVGPAKATFVRCLGCTESGYKQAR